jgi:acetate kinase
VGHRVAHGGPLYSRAVLLNEAVVEQLGGVADLAPLQQAAALRLYGAVAEILPGTPSVACFDTSFHSGMPEAGQTYAVPLAWRDQLGVRRYGAHGLSHAYAVRRVTERTGRPGSRLVVAHLGAGSSLAAVVGGRSIECTSGFTPMDGLVTGSGAGTVDPDVVLWLQTRKGMPAHEVGHDLHHESGLRALAGTSDMAEVLEAVESPDRGGQVDAAKLALAVYVHRIALGIGAMAAAAHGLDDLVFTGGVGEGSAVVRELVSLSLAHLGVAIDPLRNAQADHSARDADVSAASAGAFTFVVHSREDLQIAAETRSVLRGQRRSTGPTTP